MQKQLNKGKNKYKQANQYIQPKPKFDLPPSNQYPDCLSQMFIHNSSLIHVDLSHNKILEKDVEIMNVGLNENQHILGIHMSGNCVDTNAKGYVIQQPPHLSMQHIRTRINEQLHIGQSTNVLSKHAQNYAMTLQTNSNCWICDGWTEVKFTFNTKDIAAKYSSDEFLSIERVYLHADFDNFE